MLVSLIVIYFCMTRFVIFSNKLLFQRLISRVIKEDRDCMIEDIDVLTRNDRQFRQDAFCRCINARLNEG